MRIILFTGKGGVGKTSVAAATALRAAELGHKTIIVSTDSAHSLSDSFDISLGGEPRLIVPNLWGQETEMSQTISTHWETIQEWMAALLAWRGMEEIMADEMAILPGMEELANLLYISDYHDNSDYDLIVMDCAPTADTLRLLSFPEILHWWMEKMFPIGRSVSSILRPVVRPMLGVPIPNHEVFDSIEQLYDNLDRMRTLLTDSTEASVRLVTNPEKMVIKETQRTFTYLNLYGYPIDLIICNRLIPDRVEDSYFDSWKQSQTKYHQMIEECFAPLPILALPLLEQEVAGISMLRLTGDTLYGGEDPTKVFFFGQAQKIQRENGYYTLSLNIPFINKGDIVLSRSGDELNINIGRFKRNIILPYTLKDLPVTEARLDNGTLVIKFKFEQEKERKANTSRG
jgi:arsenite-transporting ATPase